MLPDSMTNLDADSDTAFSTDNEPITVVIYVRDTGEVVYRTNAPLGALDAMTEQFKANDGYPLDKYDMKAVPGHDAGEEITGWKANKADRPVPVFPREVAWLLHENEEFNRLAYHKGTDMAALQAISHEDGLNCSMSIADMEDDTWATFENRVMSIFDNLEMQEEVQPSAG